MKLIFISKKRGSIIKKIMPYLGIVFCISLIFLLVFCVSHIKVNFFDLASDYADIPIVKAKTLAPGEAPVKLSGTANIDLPIMPESTRIAKVPILMYHYVEPLPLVSNKLRKNLTVLPKDFKDQMQWLKENGYNTITLSELYEVLAGERVLAEKSIVLTFDDGYDGVYTYAAPIMSNFGQTADFFIITGSVGRPGYMDWEEIKKLSELGFEIGSHTVSHLSLTKLSAINLEKELLNSKKILEEKINLPVLFLCYPSGVYDKRVIGGAQAVGYRAAVTTKSGFVSANNLYETPRVRINGSISLEDFISQIENATSK